MFAFLKGMGEYIGGTVVGKVIVVAVVAGTITTGGIVAANQPHMAANVVESESMSTSDVISDSTIATDPSNSTVAVDPSSAVNEINQAASEGVSQVQQAAASAVSQVQATQPIQPTISIVDYGYAVINPDTGDMVWPDQPNYSTYKAALGGDAGTVDPAKSTAVQAALVKIATEKAAAQSAAQAALSSSAASSSSATSSN